MPDESPDSVDPEFTDEDIAAQASSWVPPPPPPPQRSNKYWPAFVILALVAGIALGYFFFADHERAKEETAKADWPSGFAELLDCTYTTSFDGTKELELYDNSHATVYDKTIKVNGKYKSIEGTWQFDEATKLYTVTLDGRDVSYSLAKPFGFCILAKGDLNAVDLNGSWFTSVSN